jgi:cell division septation protein DedD
MESIANRPRPMSSRPQRTYRIEMGGRTVLVSLSLAVLTGLVLFYMGVLTGKGSRTAETPAPEGTTSTAPSGAQSGAQSGKLTETDRGKLAFSEALLKDKPVVEDLLKNQQQTTQQTQDLLARAQRELTVEEVPAPGLATARREPAPPAAAATATAPAALAPSAPSQAKVPPHREAPAKPAAAAQQPANKPAAAAHGDDGLFTVQVFSSQSRESAAQFVNRLKGMGFPAYLNQFQDAGHATWYRVRVGKTSHSEAERLKSSLEQKANLKTIQVLQL